MAAEGIVKSIKRLEESVINRIAAGEVIQRPSNALKELIENSLDAGSTSVSVTVKNGGLKLLQIQDNGCGIEKEDLYIVCERFTTSKLETFEDLSSINTYGFRGEALASISHVAHITITTRTANSKCAYKASYSDGKMVSAKAGSAAEPRPCAGNKGTLITIEDLFYNMPTRRSAMKNPSDEYRKIADVVGKYAIHNTGISFSLKKYGDNTVDIKTSCDSTIADNISAIYGQSVARELLEISHNSEKLRYKMNGMITNANYSTKKFVFLLFINHRLVDCSSLRKAIETVYSTYLPKHTHPFIYLSLEILAANVDVNVHPTKHEVHFLHEEAIVESIQKTIEDMLLSGNESRTYYTQTLLPGAIAPLSLDESTDRAVNDTQIYPHQKIRTDSQEQTLDAFIKPPSQLEIIPSSETVNLSSNDATGSICSSTNISSSTIHTTSVNSTTDAISSSFIISTAITTTGAISVTTTTTGSASSGTASSSSKTTTNSKGSKRLLTPSVSSTSAKKRKHNRTIYLTSIKNLLQSVKKNQHKELTNLFHQYKFVGCVNQIYSLIQYQTRLYLINMTNVTRELFYQLVLLDFANFGTLQLNPPPSVYKLAMLGLESSESGWTPQDQDKNSLAESVVDVFKQKGEMLEEYFSMKIDVNGCLVSLPVLLDSFSPNLDKLPLFILRLATEVNWQIEQECFEGIAKELSLFYEIKHDQFLLDSEGDEDDSHLSSGDSVLLKRLPWRWIIEHVVFPAARRDLIPPKSMADDGTILQIADLKELYKVFERC